MHVEFLVTSGEVSLLMSPEDIMEEELLKKMLKQDNDITEIRSSVIILNKTFRNGVFIAKKTSTLIVNTVEPVKEEPTSTKIKEKEKEN